MIISFRDKDTEVLFRTAYNKRLPSEVIKRARRLLDRLDHALDIRDLHVPPSNRLEKLHGKGPDRWSIRVNRQYRITFEWTGSNAEGVAFEDYH